MAKSKISRIVRSRTFRIAKYKLSDLYSKSSESDLHNSKGLSNKLLDSHYKEFRSNLNKDSKPFNNKELTSNLNKELELFNKVKMEVKFNSHHK